MALFTKHYHPPGTTPGSLQAHPKRVERPCRFRLVRYDKGTFHVEEHDDFSAIEGSRATDGGLAWLHVQGHPSSEQLTTIGAHYRLHALALEDVHNTGQRPKVEEYDGQAFVVDPNEVALGKILRDDPPQFVLAGINHGPNLGEDVHYSGTVAAAMEGCIQGLPAAAIQAFQGMLLFFLLGFDVLTNFRVRFGARAAA